MLWSEDYEIGNELIDGEHKEIFARIDLLMAAKTDDEVRQMAVFMANYVVEHFRDEEELMRSVGYPDYDAHRQLHAEFRQSIEAKVMQINTSVELEGLKVELYNETFRWLIGHVLGVDTKIARFIRNQSRV